MNFLAPEESISSLLNTFLFFPSSTLFDPLSLLSSLIFLMLTFLGEKGLRNVFLSLISLLKLLPPSLLINVVLSPLCTYVSGVATILVMEILKGEVLSGDMKDWSILGL